MDDISELAPCRVCGKKLEEVSSWDAILPLEVVLRALPLYVHPSSLRHFQCPDKHGGVVLMPKMTDEERKQAIKIDKQRIAN
jgi:hypothetical protein